MAHVNRSSYNEDHNSTITERFRELHARVRDLLIFISVFRRDFASVYVAENYELVKFAELRTGALNLIGE